MKKVLKILLPVLLAIAVVVSIGWYFLKYDPDLTRDLLVAQARRQEAKGNHSAATWFYDLAYRQSGEDETIAIELAEQYRSIGNYTKAEYTLANAIKSGGSLELYTALCQTYVEQDKLLDAVTMLNNVADPAIKSQLDSLRPEPPVASKESGHYNEYITLSFTATSGKAFVTTDGLYPSQKNNLYTEPISLPGGETTVQALTVDDQGLVSTLVVLDYTIAGVIEPVELADPALEQVIREQLNVSAEHVLYSNELWGITSLVIPRETVTLSDLSWMPFLEKLTISCPELESLTPLASLTSLQTLTISGTPVTAQDLQAIATLPVLTRLSLADCGLSGITELSGAAELTYLDLSSNTIRDLTALGTMPYLQEVDLSHNALTSVEILGGLTNLKRLDISYNSVTSTAPLANCSHLTELDVANNLLTSLSGVDALVSLTKFSAAFNQLTDISNLSTCVGITDLNISNNALSDISVLSALTNLITLNFSYNQVTALPNFSGDCPLVTIQGTQNQLTSLQPLSVLEQLNYVMMDFNTGITSVAPLAGCYQLVEVSVYGTGVTDVSSITGNNSNVIVNYSPI